MPEATFQQLTTVLPGEEPFIGDLFDGELAVNSADGRIWTGDSIGTPIELGGAVKNAPMGALTSSNYLEVDMTSPDNLPVSNTNPLDIPEGFYREHRILFKFPLDEQLLENLTVYFDYEVDWGSEASWKISDSGSTWGGVVGGSNIDATNPIDYYKAPGRKLMVELSSFGPSASWMGRLLWASSDF